MGFGAAYLPTASMASSMCAHVGCNPPSVLTHWLDNIAAHAVRDKTLVGYRKPLTAEDAMASATTRRPRARTGCRRHQGVRHRRVHRVATGMPVPTTTAARAVCTPTNAAAFTRSTSPAFAYWKSRSCPTGRWTGWSRTEP